MKFRAALLATALGAPLMGAAPAPALPPVAVDPHIASMIASISAARLRADDEALVGFGTRNLFSDTATTPNRGVFAARDWIRKQFEEIAKTSGGRMTVTLDTYTAAKTANTPRDAVCSSVVAVLKGDDASGRTYVMSSHFDSRNSDGNDATKDAPGADDNGSGTSAVIEAARALAPHRFHGTIVFATFDGEEQGLYGSDHYAKLLKSQNVEVAGNINNDIVGSSHGHDGEYEPYRVRLFSEAIPVGAERSTVNGNGSENDSSSRELARFVATTSEAYVKPMQVTMIYRADRYHRGGDQMSFSAMGFPAVRFVEAHENFDHQHQDIRVEHGLQYGDLVKYVDFDYLARVARMNAASLAALALGPAAPSGAQLINELGYTTTLRWTAVPDAVSYEVVWRGTNASQWQYVKNVGDVTQATVAVSKDDYLLGIRAVDAQGHRSVVSYPTPVRS